MDRLKVLLVMSLFLLAACGGAEFTGETDHPQVGPAPSAAEVAAIQNQI